MKNNTKEIIKELTKADNSIQQALFLLKQELDEPTVPAYLYEPKK